MAGDGPRYLVVHEVADVGVVTVPAYLERLDHPTVWTREVMPSVRGMNRSLCRVEASFGRGVGHAALSIRLSPVPDRRTELGRWLRAELQRWCGLPGLAGAHLLWADTAASRAPTREKQLRAQPDAVADWVLLVEGYDRAAVRDLRAGALSPGVLEGHGARPEAIGNLYELVHLVAREDVMGSTAGPAAPAPSARA